MFFPYVMLLVQVLYSGRASWKKQHLKSGDGDMDCLDQGEGVGEMRLETWRGPVARKGSCRPLGRGQLWEK